MGGQPLGARAPGDQVGPAERGKIFAFLSAGGVGVKGGPTREVADEWLHRFPGDATVMRYIGRSGWNDLAFGGAISDEELLEAVDESHLLVVAKLPKRLRLRAPTQHREPDRAHQSHPGRRCSCHAGVRAAGPRCRRSRRATRRCAPG